MTYTPQKVPRIKVEFQFIGEDHEKFNNGNHWDTDACHIPRIGEQVQFPEEVFEFICEVTDVIWNMSHVGPSVFIEVTG